MGRIRVPTKDWTRARCPDTGDGLIALYDASDPDDPVLRFLPDALEAKLLAWRDDLASVAWGTVEALNEIEECERSAFDIVCPTCGTLNRHELEARVEAAMRT